MTLSQHLTKASRIELVKACLLGYRSTEARSPMTRMAFDLEVSYDTIAHWTRYKPLISDVTTEKLIALAVRINLEKAREILLGDLEEHRREVEDLLY